MHTFEQVLGEHVGVDWCGAQFSLILKAQILRLRHFFCFLFWQVGGVVFFNADLSHLPRGTEGKLIRVEDATAQLIMVSFNGAKGVVKRSQVR